MDDVSNGAANRRCPDCGGEMYSHTRAPGVRWCEECEREFWREGDHWMSCGVEGVPKLVLPGGDSA